PCARALLASLIALFAFCITRPPPRSPLFPYTTLFRSVYALGSLRERFTGTINLARDRIRLAADAGEERVAGRDPEELEAEARRADRKSTRLNSSHVKISYAVFCLKKKRYYNTSRTRPS